MALPLGEGAELRYIYTIYDTVGDARNYLIDFTIEMHNMANVMANQANLALAWSNRSYQNERGFTNENTFTTVAYHHDGESDIEELAFSEESENKEISTALEWIAFKQQFFSSVIIAPKGGISTADVAFSTLEPNSGYIKDFSALMTLPLSPSSDKFDMHLYLGPNDYSILSELNDLGYGELEMDKLVPLGWGIFGWVNKWLVIPVFNVLRGHIASFGLIILILSVLIKVLIAPYV